MSYAILDSSIFINKEYITALHHLTTPGVIDEIKDEQTKLFIAEKYFLTVKEPTRESVKKIKNFIAEFNTNLSETDIELIALTYEIYEEQSGTWLNKLNYNEIKTVKCYTRDIGIQSILNELNLDGYNVTDKYFKYRCFACKAIYERQRDFCSTCGHKTVTRVSFMQIDGKEVICLKKNYKYREKQIKDKKGNDIVCEDISQYKKYQRNKQT